MTKLLLYLAICLSLPFPVSAQYETEIFPNDSSKGDNFSSDVLINYPWLLVGAMRKHIKPHSGGSVYVFKKDSSGWKQKRLFLPKPGSDDSGFGRAIDHYAKRYFFSCNEYNTLQNIPGSIYFYQLEDTSWKFIQRITPANSVAYNYGYCLSTDKNFLIVGASGSFVNGIQSGAAYIYRFNGQQYIDEQELTVSNASIFDAFGESVALSDTIAVIGAPDKSSIYGATGMAYIFTFDGNAWHESAQLLPGDLHMGDNFGYSVAIRGKDIFVGANYNGINSHGSVYWYRFDGSSWQLLQKIVPNDSSTTTSFGNDIGIGGNNQIIIAAEQDFQSGTDAGAIYLFVLDNGKWVQNRKIIPSNIIPNQTFGRNVDLEGNLALSSSQSYPITLSAYYYGSAYIFDVCSFPAVIKIPDYPICPGDSIHLKAGCATDSINWFDRNGLLLADSHIYAYKPLQNDTIWAEFWSTSGFYGITGYDTVFIHIEPTAIFTADTACLGQPTHFTDLTQVSTPWHYQWDFNNDGVVDDSTQGNTAFTYPAEGYYTAKLTVENMEGCRDSVLMSVQVGCSGINSINTCSRLRVYPNPASSELSISWTSGASGALSLRMIDALGRTVWNHFQVAGSATNKLLLNIQSLPDGLYLIRLETANGVTAISWMKE